MSTVDFKSYIFIWNMLLCTFNMKSKDPSKPVKQAIIGLKYQNKPTREKEKPVWPTDLFGVFLKTLFADGLRNSKRLRRPQMRTVVDVKRFLSLVQKNPLTTGGQIKNILKNIGESVPKSTIKRRLGHSKCRGFILRC